MAEGNKLDISDVIANFIIKEPYGTSNCYPSKTIVVGTAIIRYSKGTEIIPEIFQRVYRNEPDDNHAERQFIRDLEDKIQQREDSVKEIIVNLVQNYSPCPSCVEKIIAFMKTNNTESWTIKFANFYNIYYKPGKEERKKNKNSEHHILGLVKLLKNGVKLKPLGGEEAWKEFWKKYVDPNVETIGLKLASSPKRKKREEHDEKIFEYINNLASGKDGANTEEVAGELKEDGKKSKEDGGESEEDGKKSEEDGKESEEDGGESKEDGGESEEDGKESKKDGGELEKVEKKMPNLKLTDD